MHSHRRPRPLRIVALVISALLLVYFAFYALYGDRGLLAQRRLERDVAITADKLEKMKAERLLLEKKTSGLRPESLDADLIDEQARKQLGITKEGEQVIVTPPDKR